MQNVQEMRNSNISARLHRTIRDLVDKSSDTNNNNMSEVVKKLRLCVRGASPPPGPTSGNGSEPSPPPQQTQPTIPVTTTTTSNTGNYCNNNTTATVPSSSNYFQASLVGEKYLLMDQVEGSSLFRCVNVHTQQELVCKVVTRDSNNLIAAHYRLDSEPRVSSLHEVLLGDRYLYLVFPRAHGDLHSYVRQRRRIREPEARRLFRQVAETVRACHREGIVLRDLKLRKFVFADTQRTELKLESLEDAVVLEEPENDWLHDKRGCPAYVSPEILRAGAHYSGKAADMWSLGVILYTMLVGRYPFNDSEHASLFAKISRGHFLIPECLSARARCLISSLLRREPSQRITSEDILYHPWLVHEDKDYQSRACDQLVPQCNTSSNANNSNSSSSVNSSSTDFTDE